LLKYIELLIQRSKNIDGDYNSKSIIGKFINRKEEFVKSELFSKVLTINIENEFAKLISDNVLFMMIAGTDSTKSALESMIDHLADNKEVVEFIRQKQEENQLFVDGKLDFEKLNSQT